LNNNNNNEFDLFLIHDEGDAEHSNSNILKINDSVASVDIKKDANKNGRNFPNCGDISKIGIS